MNYPNATPAQLYRYAVATRRQADGRIDEILGLLRRIAAELGVTS